MTGTIMSVMDSANTRIYPMGVNAMTTIIAVSIAVAVNVNVLFFLVAESDIIASLLPLALRRYGAV